MWRQQSAETRREQDGKKWTLSGETVQMEVRVKGGGEHKIEKDTTPVDAPLSPGRVWPGITSTLVIPGLGQRRTCCDRARPRVSLGAQTQSSFYAAASVLGESFLHCDP